MLQGSLKLAEKCIRFAGLLLILAVLFAACGDSGQKSSGPVTITYTYSGNGAPKDLQMVQDAINKILVKDINVQVKLNPLDWGTFGQKIPLQFKAHQQCDVVFTAPWLDGYANLAANRDLLPLDDLLQKDAPQLYNSLKPQIWNAVRINGKIYGVINQQYFPKSWGFAVRKDLATKYNLDANSINSYADLTPFLAQLKAGEPELTSPIYNETGSGNIFEPELFGWDPLGDNFAVQIKADDPTHKIFAMWQSPEFKQASELKHQWRLAGYYAKSDLPQAEAQAAFKAGKYGIIIGNQWAPGADQSMKATYNYDFVGKSLAPAIITGGSVGASLNSICSTSPHPTESIKFLQELNTNKAVYNLLSYGIEGKHWVWVDKTRNLIGFPSGLSATTDRYWPNTNWMFGNTFNAYYTDLTAAQQDLNAQSLKGNQDATPSTALGFSLNQDPVKTQLAQFGNVGTQYAAVISGISDVDANWPKFQAALKQAGIDDIVTEAQKQIDAWAKTQGG